MKKRIQLKQMVSFCFVVLMVFAMPLTCLAGPTIEDIENGKYTDVVVGRNVHRCDIGYILYRFVAPESGSYSIKINNIGANTLHYGVFNEDLEWLNRRSYGYYDNIYSNSFEYLYEKITLKQGQVLYIDLGDEARSTAGYITITSLAPKKPIRTLSKTALSLRTGKQETLYFTGDKSKATWVSRDPAIATVSQNGAVTGKKKGVTFIYSIVNHKLYKTKVSVY